MKIVSGNNFYIVIESENITLCNSLYCVCYPIWLGKNRKNYAFFKKELLENESISIVDVLDISAKLCMTSIGNNKSPNKDLLK